MITAKNDQRIIVVHVLDNMYHLSKEDRIFIVENFAVLGGVVKLSMPLRITEVEM